MSLLSLFVDSKFEVRSGWKFAAYAAILVFLFVVMSVAVGGLIYIFAPTFLLLPRSDVRFLALNTIVLFIPSAVALLVMARLDRVRLPAFGLTFHEGWLRDLGMGIAIAGVMVAVALIGSFLFGVVEMKWNASVSTIPAIITTVVVLLLAAFNEELVFRGYPLQILLKGIGPWGAILLVSLIFASLHVWNEGANFLTTINTVIAGVLLALAYMKTRSIWLPYGIHLAWNIGTSVVVGVPVSGIRTPSLLATEVAGPKFLVGGGYGPEDGLLGTFIFLAGAIAVSRLKVGKVSPQVQSALAAHADKVYIEAL